MKSGFSNNPPRKLQYFTGSLSIKSFDFSKDSRTTAATRARGPLTEQEIVAFIGGTQIKTPQAAGFATAPFALWPAQAETLATIHRERLAVILKARQLGITWLLCGYILCLCTQIPGQVVLVYSQGQLEANEIIDRISFMHHHHHRADLAPLLTDNKGELEWANSSQVLSLPSTQRAGRSFTASLAVLDEFAFMQWGQTTLGAVKPTIDGGGKLVILSSADGNGTPYHQLWNVAKSGASGYVPIFLPWTARPDRGPDWRDAKLVESGGDTATVYREYPANDIEAFTNATGLVYDCWSDGPEDGNVTEAADYIVEGGLLYWGVDDGYVGTFDPRTRQYTAESHPRVFGLYQVRPDGTICRFAESYEVGKLSDTHITDVLAMNTIAGYPTPTYAAVDKSAAELKGRLYAANIYTRNSPQSVAESIKEMRRAIAPDANGRRRLLVHPRCRHFRYEMASYRNGPDGTPVKQHDHGPDECRYLIWTLRHDV